MLKFIFLRFIYLLSTYQKTNLSISYSYINALQIFAIKLSISIVLSSKNKNIS